MRKNVIKVLTILLVLSILSNAYLLGWVGQMSRDLKQNISRISFMENNFDQAVKQLILEETASKEDDLLDEVKFNLSDLTDKKAKKAMIDIEFKLKRMDSTTRTYASIECGDGEPILMEIQPINDTTYRIEREICILEPVRVDLVIEKYGEKKLINLVLEDEIYQKFVGDSQFELSDFDYEYTADDGKLLASFSTEIRYTPRQDNKLEEAYVAVEKNGVTIKRVPLVVLPEIQKGESFLYGAKITDLELLGIEGDQILMAVILQERNSFIHRYEFAKCLFEKGEENIRVENTPILTLK